jgi:glycolate oxidase FAD binding subunit
MTQAVSADIRKRPATVDELSTHIQAAHGARARVRVEGSASMPVVQFDDGRPVHSLSTLRLNKIIDHAVADMTVTVQAGITLEVLQRHLAWQNQWLPVDPPAVGGRLPGQRTIGGLIATNSLGPLRMGVGDWRLLVLGMKWVDATGAVLTSGGRTVKNVAGYAVHRLLIGSGGALGAIAEVTLRTFARPADERCVVFFCPGPAQAEALVAAVLVSPVTPAYVQLVGARTFASNPLQLPAPVGKGGAGMVAVVGFLGRPEVCAAQVEAVRALADAGAGVDAIAQTAAQAGRLRLWMTTEPALPDVGGIGFRMAVRSSQAAETLAALEGLEGPGVWAAGEAAAGVIRGSVHGPGAAGGVARAAERAGATWVATQGDGPRVQANEITRRLKAALDPQGVWGD